MCMLHVVVPICVYVVYIYTHCIIYIYEIESTSMLIDYSHKTIVNPPVSSAPQPAEHIPVQ